MWISTHICLRSRLKFNWISATATFRCKYARDQYTRPIERHTSIVENINFWYGNWCCWPRVATTCMHTVHTQRLDCIVFNNNKKKKKKTEKTTREEIEAKRKMKLLIYYQLTCVCLQYREFMSWCIFWRQLHFVCICHLSPPHTGSPKRVKQFSLFVYFLFIRISFISCRLKISLSLLLACLSIVDVCKTSRNWMKWNYEKWEWTCYRVEVAHVFSNRLLHCATYLAESVEI